MKLTVLLKRIFSSHINLLIPSLRNFLTSPGVQYNSIAWDESNATKGSNNDLFIKSRQKNEKNKNIYIEFILVSGEMPYLEIHQYHPDAFDPNIGGYDFHNMDHLIELRYNNYWDLFNSIYPQGFESRMFSSFGILNAGRFIICYSIGSETNSQRYNTVFVLAGSLKYVSPVKTEFYILTKNFDYMKSSYCIDGNTMIRRGSSDFNNVFLSYYYNLETSSLTILSSQLSIGNPLWHSKVFFFEKTDNYLFDYQIVYQVPKNLVSGTTYQIGNDKFIVFYGAETDYPALSAFYSAEI